MPKPDELLFALKTFASAMLALYLAFWLGLDNPYWAMATAFIVAHPLSGAVRSKSLYRFIGTLIGGTAAVALVPNLVDAPVLLSLALACWLGLCLYISLLDRTPHAYTFMLAGYTAAIIGFPSVDNPGSIFEVTLTRVEEISIGVFCTTLVSTIFLPRPVGPVLALRIAGWVRPATDWATAALAGQDEQAAIAPARRKLAVEAADVAMMTTQLAFDTSHLQGAVAHIRQLRACVLSLVPVLSSISDRVAQLRAMDGLTPALHEVLEETRHWVQASGPERADAVLARIKTLEHDPHSWTGLLQASLAVRLEELVHLLRHARAIHRHVVEGDPAPDTAKVKGEFVAVAALLPNHGLAMLSALAAAITVLLICAFWIGTEWTAGGTAALMGAIGCSFFATQDDPAPAISLMIRDTMIGILGAAFYVFVVLPPVESFVELALVLLPACLVAGVMIARPKTFMTGLIISVFGATILAINNGYQGSFLSFVDGGIALIAGLCVSLVVTRLIRSVGAAWSARQLLRGAWQDIVAAAETKTQPDRAVMTGRMMDRLGVLMPRLAAIAPGEDILAADLLRDLRVGLNVIALQRALPGLPHPAQADVTAVLAEIRAHYRGNPLKAPRDALHQAIDAALCPLAATTAHHRETLLALSGLRLVLFAAAPPPEIGPWTMTQVRLPA